MDRCVRITALALCAVLIFAVEAAPQGAASIVTRSAGVTVIAEPIEVDGVLDEAAWKSATKIGELVQRQPATGQAPSERTEVVLLRDENHLYVGIYAYDAEPDRVIGTQMMRDGSLAADDRIELLLDTFRDQRSAFYFATNPAGALVDGLAFANGQLNTDWDAIWQVRTSRTTDGWVAEFAIPFKSLSFPAGQDVWGFNVARIDLSQARRRSLVGRTARHAVPSGVRSRRDHEPHRPHAGHRARSSAVSRRPVAQ